MKRINLIATVLSVMALAGLALAAEPGGALQNQPLPPAKRVPGQARTAPQRQRVQPCWEEVGISKQAIEQRRAIQERTRSEISGVCSNATLTERQKLEQIRAIRLRAHQEIEAVIPPERLQQLETCQKARRKTPVPLAGGPRTGYPRHGPCDLR